MDHKTENQIIIPSDNVSDFILTLAKTQQIACSTDADVPDKMKEILVDLWVARKIDDSTLVEILSNYRNEQRLLNSRSAVITQIRPEYRATLSDGFEIVKEDFFEFAKILHGIPCEKITSKFDRGPRSPKSMFYMSMSQDAVVDNVEIHRPKIIFKK